MAAMTEQRREKLVERMAWLDASLEKLQRDYVRAPLWAWASLLAVPVWLFWSWMVAGLVVFTAVTLAGVQRYVAWIHIDQCETGQRLIREARGTVTRDLST